MKERFEAFLNAWLKTADRPGLMPELKALYFIATGDYMCSKSTCVAKAVREVRKYLDVKLNNPEAEPARKYMLKPGLHQFAPGGPAVHCNENTSDSEIEFYLTKYPHIQKLLI